MADDDNPHSQVLPIVCFTCGGSLHDDRSLYDALIDEDGFSEADALGEIGNAKNCCRRHILTDSNVPYRYNGNSEVSYDLLSKVKIAKTKVVPKTAREIRPIPIPHLGGYTPSIAPRKFVYPDDLVLKDEAKLKSTAKTDSPATPVLWRQRERFMTIVRLLSEATANKHYDEDIGLEFLYLGASGFPIEIYLYLSNLFPNTRFILFDTPTYRFPKEYKKYVENNKKISFEAGPFTQEKLASYTQNNKRLPNVFMCEQILADKSQGDSVYEGAYYKDLTFQNAVLKKLKEISDLLAALLYYRPPNIPGEFKYPTGTIWLSPWKNNNSTEVYLFVKLKKGDYDLQDRETHAQKLNYFQTVTRTHGYTYTTKIPTTIGLDMCYDCAAEWNIWEFYFKKLGNVNKEGDNTVLNTSTRTALIKTNIAETSSNLDKTQKKSLLTPPAREF